MSSLMILLCVAILRLATLLYNRWSTSVAPTSARVSNVSYRRPVITNTAAPHAYAVRRMGTQRSSVAPRSRSSAPASGSGAVITRPAPQLALPSSSQRPLYISWGPYRDPLLFTYSAAMKACTHGSGAAIAQPEPWETNISSLDTQLHGAACLPRTSGRDAASLLPRGRVSHGAD
jgi:hypothetical protein